MMDGQRFGRRRARKSKGGKARGGSLHASSRSKSLRIEELEKRRLLATFVVLDPGDLDEDGEVMAGTLRAAIEASNENDDPNIEADTIVFAQSLFSYGSRTISLNGDELIITGPLTILGPSADKLTVNGPGDMRVFNVDDGDDDRTARVTIGGMTITGGGVFGDGDDNRGGGVLNKENLTIIESIITGNGASNGGGGVFNERGQVTITRSLIQNNSSGGPGAGVLNSIVDATDVSPVTTIINSTVTGNIAGGDETYGGGAYNAQGTLKIYYSTFVGNEATLAGKGVGSAGNPPPEEEGADPPPPIVFTFVSGSIIADGADENLMPENEDDPEKPQSLFSVGFNIVSSGNMMLFASDLKTNPMLVADAGGAPLLGDFGGVVPVFLPEIGSPAIDAGSLRAAQAGSFENRGRHFRRIFDYTESGTPRIDIGATERQRGVFEVDELYDESDGQFNGIYLQDAFEGTQVLDFGGTYTVARDFTLREAVDFSTKNPDTDAITFSQQLLLRRDLAPFTRPPTLLLSNGQLTLDDPVIIQGPSTYELEIDASGNDPTPNINNSDGTRIFTISDGSSSNSIDVVINNLTLRGGDAVNSGGGILNFENLSMNSVTMTDNAASNDGGALYVAAGGVKVENATFHANFAGDDGAGIYVERTDGSVDLLNSTLSGNTSGDRGAGILNANGIVTISYSTITNNQAASLRASGVGSGVGGTQNTNTATRIRSTIISGNGNKDIEEFGLVLGKIESLGYNLVGNGNAAALFNATGDQTGVLDPQLKPLAKGGGIVPTHEPLGNSPAIDAGDPAAVAGVGDVPTTDQRGLFYTRVFDGNTDGTARIDIGSYELQGVTFIVDTRFDENDGNYTPMNLSLREAIELSNASPLPDFIEFDSMIMAGATINMVGELALSPFTSADMKITDSVAITGLGSPVLTINAAGSRTKQGAGARVFTIDDDNAANQINVTISGLTIRNASADVAGGTILSRERLELDDMFWFDNTALASGGVLYQDGASVQINNSTVTGNATAGVGAMGGGIYARNANVEITYSSISGNTTAATQAHGGGVAVKDSSLHLFETTLTGNSTPGGQSDGGGFFANGGVVVIDSSVVAGNVTAGSNSEGAGFYSLGSLVTFHDSTLSINQTVGTQSAGGGGYINGGSVVFNNSAISQNTTGGLTAGGGGVYLANGLLTINDSTVIGNRTTGQNGHGGGIHNAGGTLAINNSTFTTNTVSGTTAKGGGIYNATGGTTGQTRIVNSTLSGNVSFDHGGGLYNHSGAARLLYSTVTNNSAPFYAFGGGVASYGGNAATTSVQSTIIAGNLGSDVDIFAGSFANSFQSLGYNLIGTGLSKNAFAAIGDLTGVVNPMLGALIDHGGPTLTHEPLPGSPAIHAGNPAAIAGSAGVPQFDQRGSGFARVRSGRIDIGAVETSFSSLAADFDSDGDIDGFDFLTIQRGYGKPAAEKSDGDANSDNLVNGADMALWATGFGTNDNAPSGPGGPLATPTVVAAITAPPEADSTAAPTPPNGAATHHQRPNPLANHRGPLLARVDPPAPREKPVPKTDSDQTSEDASADHRRHRARRSAFAELASTTKHEDSLNRARPSENREGERDRIFDLLGSD